MSAGAAHKSLLGSAAPHPLFPTFASWICYHVTGVGTLIAGVLTQVEAETQSRRPT